MSFSNNPTAPQCQHGNWNTCSICRPNLTNPTPQENGWENEAKWRQGGCEHQLGRMKTWCEQGTCPICLTAELGMLRESFNSELARARKEERERIKELIPSEAKEFPNTKYYYGDGWNNCRAAIIQAIQELK